jgi:hypothetical protein
MALITKMAELATVVPTLNESENLRPLLRSVPQKT